MKKTLLTLACATVLGSTANAQVCESYKENNFHKMSENGVWLVENNNNTITVYNRTTKKYTFLEGEGSGYAVGIGNSVINDGNVCIAYSDKGAALLKDSVFTLLDPGRELAPGENLTMSIAHGGTSDGKRIVGVVNAPKATLGGEDLMAFPVMWEKDANGVYKFNKLPYPAKDFTGRHPQYVTAVDISDDGKTIAGQIQDYTGFYTTPIVWKEDAEGKWTYSTPGEDLIYNPDSLSKLPEPPVAPKEPVAENYMTKDDSVAYVQALAEYNELSALAQLGEISWDEVPEYPEKGNFISDSTRADAYADAIMDYNKKNEQYWTDFFAFDEILQTIVTGNVYAFNNIALSRNGKYMVTSIQKTVLEDPLMPWTAITVTSPCRFYLTEANDSIEIVSDLENHLSSGIADNGLLVSVSPAMEYTRNAYVSMPGEPAQSFVDYLAAEKQDSVVKFLKDNYTYTFNVEVGVDSMGAPIYQEVQDSTITGTLSVNGEGNRFVSFIYDQMSNPENATFVTFFIDLTKNAGPSAIENVVNKENTGEVLRREYYNLQGQRIAQPTKGIYLEKVITTNGVYTKKVLK